MLQIVGADMINSHLVKISCIPYTTSQVKQKKPSIFEIAKGGASVQDLIRESEDAKLRLTVFYLNRDVWINEFKNRLYSVIEVDINVDVLYEG